VANTKIDSELYYYSGDKFKIQITEFCLKALKKSGLLVRVVARLKKIADTGHLGKEKEGYKYYPDEQLGWLKWKNGVRVYFSIDKEGNLFIVLLSGNKNSQEKDIKEAKEILLCLQKQNSQKKNSKMHLKI